MAADTTRIYVVSPRIAVEGEPVKRRLVRAANSAQAFRHVAKDTLLVALAGQDDLVVLASAGVKVETAKQDKD